MLSRTIRTLVIATMILVVLASSAAADFLADITVSRTSPASIPLNMPVEVACDWEWTGNDNDISMRAIPMTNGSVSPGAYLYYENRTGPGSGRVWPSFTIQSGSVLVDEIRLTMELGDPVYETAFEVNIPVSLHFGPHSFHNIDIDFDPPERMQLGQQVTMDFIWETNHVGGHRVVIRPLTDGFYTPNMGTGGSGVLSGTSGLATRWFTVLQFPVHIDGIVFEIYNADWSDLLYEFIIPADYSYDTTAVQNVVLDPPSPASLIHGEEVTITFDYLTDHPMDPVMYAVPQTNGVHSPGFTLGPSYPLAPGFGSGTNTFSIQATAGLVDVDEILFSMHDFFDEETIIYQFRMPVYYHYSGHSIRNVEYDPKPPAILGNNTYVNLEITYNNGFAEEGWLYNHPQSGGVLTPGLDGYFRSIALPGANPPNTHFFTVTAGDQLVDQMHFQMFNLPEDWLWLNYLQDVWFYFGPRYAVAPVAELPGVVAPSLHDCFPNPFNPLTTIKFDLPDPMAAGVNVYDLRGRLVKTLVGRRAMNPGPHEAVWDGKDDAGRSVAAGVYIYRLEAGELTAAKRMTLMK